MIIEFHVCAMKTRDIQADVEKSYGIRDLMPSRIGPWIKLTFVPMLEASSLGFTSGSRAIPRIILTKS
jgi:hypothetical protein